MAAFTADQYRMAFPDFHPERVTPESVDTAIAILMEEPYRHPHPAYIRLLRWMRKHVDCTNRSKVYAVLCYFHSSMESIKIDAPLAFWSGPNGVKMLSYDCAADSAVYYYSQIVANDCECAVWDGRVWYEPRYTEMLDFLERFERFYHNNYYEEDE